MITIKEKVLVDSHGARISPALAKCHHYGTNILNTDKEISLLKTNKNNSIMSYLPCKDFVTVQ